MFPGRCVRCGGPQWWTFDRRGATWVLCQDPECVDEQLLLPGCDPSEPLTPVEPEMEPERATRVVTPEGEAATTGYEGVESQLAPPAGFLDTLWEGCYAERS